MPGFTRSPETAQRDQHAADMRSRGMTYNQIGESLGMTRQSAHEAVKRAINDIPKEGAEVVLRLELEKLDYLERRMIVVLQKEHLRTAASGKVSMHNGSPVLDDMPNMQAVSVLLKIADRRAKLLGLNTPARTELTGKDGGAIEIDDRSGEAKAKVLSLLGRLAETG